MFLPIETPASARSFYGLFVGSALAGIFVSLGGTFYAFGWNPLGYILIGVAVAIGAVAQLAMTTGRRAAERQDAARTRTGTATVLEAKSWPSPIGVHDPLRLAVKLEGKRVTRTLFVVEGAAFRPGEHIQVAYAPEDPKNFLPLE